MTARVCIDCGGYVVLERHLCVACTKRRAKREGDACRGGCGQRLLNWYAICRPCFDAGRPWQRPVKATIGSSKLKLNGRLLAVNPRARPVSEHAKRRRTMYEEEMGIELDPHDTP